MSTTNTIKRIGTGIHSYFDVIPESPDGTMVTWFRFNGKPFDRGTVMLTGLDGSNPVEVMETGGNPHAGARQGWLDNDHICFGGDGFIKIADRKGTIVNRFPGAINTVHRGRRQALTFTTGFKKFGGTPPPGEACYSIDMDSGNTTELIDRDACCDILAKHIDLTGVPEETLAFRHTKWAPDGEKWFVVLTNEHYRWNVDDSIPPVKVLLAADADGSNLRYIGPFGHHPHWLPDSSGIYAFQVGNTCNVFHYTPQGGKATILTTLPCEAHPCVSPDGKYISTDGYQITGPDTFSVVIQEIATGSHETVFTGEYPRAPWQNDHPAGRLCHAHPVWSGNGKRLYFNGVENDMPVLYSMEVL